MEEFIFDLQRFNETITIASAGNTPVTINGEPKTITAGNNNNVVVTLTTEGTATTGAVISLSAVNEGIKQSKEMVQGEMSDITGGMNIPGMF